MDSRMHRVHDYTPTKADVVPSIMPRQAPPQPPTSHSTSAHVATSSIHRWHYHDRHLQCVCSNPARPGRALPCSQATMTWQRRLHRAAASVPVERWSRHRGNPCGLFPSIAAPGRRCHVTLEHSSHVGVPAVAPVTTKPPLRGVPCLGLPRCTNHRYPAAPTHRSVPSPNSR
jgi:hypothetical protein